MGQCDTYFFRSQGIMNVYFKTSAIYILEKLCTLFILRLTILCHHTVTEQFKTGYLREILFPIISLQTRGGNELPNADKSLVITANSIKN